jgi:hypothetical protein
MADFPSSAPGANPTPANGSSENNNNHNLLQEDQEAALLPLEREILDEYARLAGSLDDVRHPLPYLFLFPPISPHPHSHSRHPNVPLTASEFADKTRNSSPRF